MPVISCGRRDKVTVGEKENNKANQRLLIMLDRYDFSL
jgi:hypothetical protein